MRGGELPLGLPRAAALERQAPTLCLQPAHRSCGPSSGFMASDAPQHSRQGHAHQLGAGRPPHVRDGGHAAPARCD